MYFATKWQLTKKNEIEIERAHRLGRKHDDGKPRPIVAKFLRYQDKEFIRKSANLLKDLKAPRSGLLNSFPKRLPKPGKSYTLL